MNIYTKILKQMLLNKAQKFKIVRHHDQLGLNP